jgi:hypothetical protein
MEKKRYYNKKKGGEAHIGREWDSDESSTDSSSNEDATNIAINNSRDTPKYTTSDDEGSSSENDDDLSSIFANLIMEQKKKINELIKTINEKDGILECQEDLLIKENKKS